jgi:hypothetical protein
MRLKPFLNIDGWIDLRLNYYRTLEVYQNYLSEDNDGRTIHGTSCPVWSKANVTLLLLV